jgi:hypothetical protein
MKLVSPIFFRRIVSRFLLSAFSFVMISSCVHDGAGDSPLHGTATIHGRLQVSLIEEFPPYWEKYTAVSGQIHDGPSPESLGWQEHLSSGACRVLIPVAPFCNPACGSTGLCTVGGVCMAFPKALNVGAITVSGIASSGGNSFTMAQTLNTYLPMGVTLDFPPFDEGGLVTLSGAGSRDAPAFTVSGRGPALPRILNDTIVLDGNPILLRWTPPGPNAGPSTLIASIDISHHGGIKGVIECVTEDDGELEIDGALVSALKELGVSGFPQLDVVRRSVASVEGHSLNLFLEARLLKYVGIPGLVSCRDDNDCSGSETCRQDFKCL